MIKKVITQTQKNRKWSGVFYIFIIASLRRKDIGDKIIEFGVYLEFIV